MKTPNPVCVHCMYVLIDGVFLKSSCHVFLEVPVFIKEMLVFSKRMLFYSTKALHLRVPKYPPPPVATALWPIILVLQLVVCILSCISNGQDI